MPPGVWLSPFFGFTALRVLLPIPIPTAALPCPALQEFPGPFAERGTGELDANELSQQARRALLLLAANAGPVTPAVADLEALVLAYRRAWAAAVAAVDPIRNKQAPGVQPKEGKEDQAPGDKNKLNQRLAQVPAQVQEVAGEGAQHGAMGLLTAGKHEHEHEHDEALQVQVLLQVDQALHFGAHGAADADGDAEADANADSADMFGAVAETAAATAPAAIHGLATAFINLAGHAAFDGLRVPFGGLMADACISHRALDAQGNNANGLDAQKPPAPQPPQCTPAQQADIARLFASQVRHA